MTMEFVAGGYNVHEHNYVERSDEQLQGELQELHTNLNRVKYSPERMKQIQARIGALSFELSERFRESKNQDITMAWLERGTK